MIVEAQIHQLKQTNQKLNDMKVRIDQQVNFQTRTMETRQESSEAKNIQIRFLKTMPQHSQEETQQLRKENQGLTQDDL